MRRSRLCLALMLILAAAAAPSAAAGGSRKMLQAFLPQGVSPATPAGSPIFLPGASPPPPSRAPVPVVPGIYLPYYNASLASSPAPAPAPPPAPPPTPPPAPPPATPAPPPPPAPAPSPAQPPVPALLTTPAEGDTAASAEPSSHGPPIAAIVVPVVVGSCLIAAVAAALLIRHRRHHKQQQQQHEAKHTGSPSPGHGRFTDTDDGGGPPPAAYPAMGSFGGWSAQQQGSGDTQQEWLISPAGVVLSDAAGPRTAPASSAATGLMSSAAGDLLPRHKSATAVAAAERGGAALAAMWMTPSAPAAGPAAGPSADWMGASVDGAAPSGSSKAPPTATDTAAVSKQNSQQQSFASPFARRFTGLLPTLESAEFTASGSSNRQHAAAVPPRQGAVMGRTGTPTPPTTPMQTSDRSSGAMQQHRSGRPAVLGSSKLSWVMPAAAAGGAGATIAAAGDSQLSGLSGLTGMSGSSASSGAAVPVYNSVAARPSRVLSGPPIDHDWNFEQVHKPVRVLMQVDEDPGIAQPVTLVLLVSAPPPKPEVFAQVVLPSDPVLSGVDLAIDVNDLALPTNSFLGQGAFGQVHRALFRGRLPVAVKMLTDPAVRQADPETMRCFHKELGIMARLEHPNIVRCYGGNLDCANPFTVCELCECSLDRIISHFKRSQGTGLPLRITLPVGLNIASALWHMHPSVVHRDLKPQNVLLDAAGTAKVTDFGLSRMKTHTFVSTRHVEAGTASYMAPECFTGDGVTEKVDIYALGMLLWECVMGERPWRHHNMMQVAYQVAMSNNRPPLPPISPDSCPAELAQLISECWTPNPRERPSSGEVMKALAQMIRVHLPPTPG